MFYFDPPPLILGDNFGRINNSSGIFGRRATLMREVKVPKVHGQSSQSFQSISVNSLVRDCSSTGKQAALKRICCSPEIYFYFMYKLIK